MARRTDPKEMERIYQVSKLVYDKLITQNEGCRRLNGQTNASEASIKMYFAIYAAMRKGICYKMGTSAAFTKFLIERIDEDFGGDSILIALSAAKLNSDYRKACENEQPGIEAVCREIIETHDLSIDYEQLPIFAQTGENKGGNNPKVTVKAPKQKEIKADYLYVKMSIGNVIFETSGDLDSVLHEQEVFVSSILRQAVALDKKTQTEKKKAVKRIANLADQPTENIPLGKRVLKKYPEIEKLKNRVDFKAKMIPLMFFATEAGFQTEFSIADILTLLRDALGVDANKREVESVLSRRPDWFEKTSLNPRKYKLLSIGMDYARNVIDMD